METSQERRTPSKRHRSRHSKFAPKMPVPYSRRYRYESQNFPYPAHDRRSPSMPNTGVASWSNQSNSAGVVIIEVHRETVHMVRSTPSSNMFQQSQEAQEPGPARIDLVDHQFSDSNPLPLSRPTTSRTRNEGGKNQVIVCHNEQEEEEEDFTPEVRGAEPEFSEVISPSICGPLALRPSNTEGDRWNPPHPSQRAQIWDDAATNRARDNFRSNNDGLHPHFEATSQLPSIHEYLDQLRDLGIPQRTPVTSSTRFPYMFQARPFYTPLVTEIPPSIAKTQAECVQVVQGIMTIRQMQLQELAILRQSELLYDKESVIQAQHELADLQVQDQALLKHLQELEIELRIQLDIHVTREAQLHQGLQDQVRERQMHILSAINERLVEAEVHGVGWDRHGQRVDLDMDRLSLEEEEDEYHSSAHADRDPSCTDPDCRCLEEDDYRPSPQQSRHTPYTNNPSTAYPLVDIDTAPFSEAKAQFKLYEQRWRSIFSSPLSTSTSTTSTNQNNKGKSNSTSPHIPFPIFSPPLPISFPPILDEYIAASPALADKAGAHVFFCLAFGLIPTIIPPPLYAAGPAPSTLPALSFTSTSSSETEAARGQLRALRAQLKAEKVRWHSDRLTLSFGPADAKTERAKSVWSVVVELKKGIDAALESLEPSGVEEAK